MFLCVHFSIPLFDYFGIIFLLLSEYIAISCHSDFYFLLLQFVSHIIYYCSFVHLRHCGIEGSIIYWSHIT